MNVERLYQRGEPIPPQWYIYDGDADISVTFGGPTSVKISEDGLHAEALEPCTPYIRIDTVGDTPFDMENFRWATQCRWTNRQGAYAILAMTP